MKILKKIKVLAPCLVFTTITCALFACGHEHQFSEDWTSDSTYHWHASTCGHNEEISDKELHSLTNGTCSVCGYHTHIFDDNWSYDKNYHWHKAICEHDELESDRAEHMFQHRKCIICSAEMPSVMDTQTILNGNFEFFNDSDDKTHIIYTPNNWSVSTAGQINYSMNGIIDTSAGGWDRISADDLADRLEYNYNLDPDDDNYDEEYVDYNGMRKRDIPYANPHSAINDDEDADLTLIDNPLTHDIIINTDKSYAYIDDNGKIQPIYTDENNRFYTDSNYNYPYDSHVLMVHNYRNLSYRYGTAQTYTSSNTISLDPNTAAEISVWVKTSNLMYSRNGETPEEGLGAFIAVEQTVGSTAIDTFYIDAINTANVTENNGWVQYTIFIEGDELTTSTISVKIGLGRADDDGDYSKALEGYAFFDDITCTLYSSLSENMDYDTVYNYGYIKDSEDKELDTICEFSSNDNTEFCYDDFKNNKDFINGFGRYFLIKL